MKLYLCEMFTPDTQKDNLIATPSPGGKAVAAHATHVGLFTCVQAPVIGQV